MWKLLLLNHAITAKRLWMKVKYNLCPGLELILSWKNMLQPQYYLFSSFYSREKASECIIIFTVHDHSAVS